MFQDQIQRLSKVQIDPDNLAASLDAMRREIINTFQSCQPLTQRGTTLFTRNSDGQPTVEIKNALGPALRINGEVEYGDDGPNALWAMGTAQAAITTSTASVTINVVAYGGGKSPGSSITVYNVQSVHSSPNYVFYGDDDSRVWVLWDAVTETYLMNQVECPA